MTTLEEDAHNLGMASYLVAPNIRRTISPDSANRWSTTLLCSGHNLYDHEKAAREAIQELMLSGKITPSMAEKIKEIYYAEVGVLVEEGKHMAMDLIPSKTWKHNPRGKSKATKL